MPVYLLVMPAIYVCCCCCCCCSRRILNLRGGQSHCVYATLSQFVCDASAAPASLLQQFSWYCSKIWHTGSQQAAGGGGGGTEGIVEGTVRARNINIRSDCFCVCVCTATANLAAAATHPVCVCESVCERVCVRVCACAWNARGSWQVGCWPLSCCWGRHLALSL